MDIASGVDSQNYFVALGHPINAGNSLFFEIETKGTITEWKHYLHAPSGLLMMRSIKSNSAAKTDVYFHKDHLGSITTITNNIGAILEQNSFDAFGKRRNANGSDATTPINSLTRRGFTEHEMLPEVNMIHMNGRVYEPTLGRFLSADPNVQFVGFSQSYNRYSYVMNNPLSLTDPSGFSLIDPFGIFDSGKVENVIQAIIDPSPKHAFAVIRDRPDGGAHDRFIQSHDWARAIGIAAAGFFGGPFAVAAISGYETYLAGGSNGDILKSAAISYVTSEAFTAVGDISSSVGGAAGNAIKIAGHAAIGCASAAASGGDCGQGALATGFGAAATVASNGNFAITVIAGGIGAELGGGKFANGALSASMGYIFNCVAHECWAQGRDAHQALETELAARPGQGFKFRGFYDSDNNAFLGFPDAYSERDKMVWELKPNTPYGHLTGPEQIERYTAISGYSPGIAGPIFGLSDTLVLSGRLGSYTYTYGGNGIIFYNPNFNSPIENAFRHNANQILAPLPGRRRNSGLD